MARALVFLIGFCLSLGACTQRQICPAFQSAYIYDKDELRKKFSYFQEDSTPKTLTASKNRYLVAEPTPYRKKLRSLQTVQMKPVYVQVPDSLVNKDSVVVADLDRAARSVIDSTFIASEQPPQPVEDSVYVISKDRELRLLKYNGADSLVYDPVADKYVPQTPEYYVKDVRLNVEQDNYMWYLRDHLVLPDVRIAQRQQATEAKEERKRAKKEKKERKGLKGFFKNLFKKEPEAKDTTQVPPPQEEEFDFIDTDTLTQAEPPARREGLLASRKNTPAVAPLSDSDTTSPSDARKEEEAIEGF